MRDSFNEINITPLTDIFFGAFDYNDGYCANDGSTGIKACSSASCSAAK